VQTVTDEAPPAERAPKGGPSPIRSSTDPFEVIRGHVPMQTLNASLLPWLIAEIGIDFASLDNHEAATEMITHIITKHELGGYTTSTFPAIVEGHGMQRTAFSKFVLRQLGNSFVFHV
jgi:hypothetical protein